MQPKSKFLRLFERDLGRCVYCVPDLQVHADCANDLAAAPTHTDRLRSLRERMETALKAQGWLGQ